MLFSYLHDFCCHSLLYPFTQQCQYLFPFSARFMTSRTVKTPDSAQWRSGVFTTPKGTILFIGGYTVLRFYAVLPQPGLQLTNVQLAGKNIFLTAQGGGYSHRLPHVGADRHDPVIGMGHMRPGDISSRKQQAVHFLKIAEK